MKQRRRIHISLPEQVMAALEALGELEDRDISEILTQLAREDLIKRGYIPPATGAEIAKVLKRRKKE
jgi:hypothetical protein